MRLSGLTMGGGASAKGEQRRTLGLVAYLFLMKASSLGATTADAAWMCVSTLTTW